MFFDVINSGSKGNATLVFTSECLILIDMGINISTLEDELRKFDKEIKDIDVCLITHNHSDHIKNIKCLSPKKIYSLKGSVAGDLSNILENNVPFKIKGVEITPFPISHDAINPCGYKIKEKDASLVYMTDTGMYLSENTPLIKNPTYLIIESNHDISMLLKTNRPVELKERIMSTYGHLCNEDSAFAALEIIGNDTKEIVLAHLSEEANTPALALQAYKNIFNYAGVRIDKYLIRCANQYIPLIGGDYED